MPYDPENPPVDKVHGLKKLSKKRQRQWVHVWNNVYEDFKEDGEVTDKEEQRCYQQAWNVVNQAVRKDERKRTAQRNTVRRALFLASENENRVNVDELRSAYELRAPLMSETRACEIVDVREKNGDVEVMLRPDGSFWELSRLDQRRVSKLVPEVLKDALRTNPKRVHTTWLPVQEEVIVQKRRSAHMISEVLRRVASELTGLRRKPGNERSSLVFGGEQEAVQYLANLTGQRVIVAKKPGWIQQLQTGNTTSPSSGIFTEGSAESIAKNLKRNSPDYQAAMAMLTMYINRAGDRLSGTRKRELERAKKVLRRIYKRTDRIQLYEKPKAKSERQRRGRVAMIHLVYEDPRGVRHVGDMFIEMLGQDDEKLNELAQQSSYHARAAKHVNEYENFLKSYFKINDVECIKRLMMKRWSEGKEVPFWDVVKNKPVVTKMANTTSVFAFDDDHAALQYLADVTGRQVKVAQDELETLELREEDFNLDVSSLVNDQGVVLEDLDDDVLRSEDGDVVLFERRRTADEAMRGMREVGVTGVRVESVRVRENGREQQLYTLVSNNFRNERDKALAAAYAVQLIRGDELE